LRLLYTLGISVMAIAMMACPKSQPLEMTARDGIAAAKGYLDSAKQHHPECAPQISAGPHAASVSTQCDFIVKGIGVKDVAIDALDAYCSNDEFQHHGGSCVPNKDVKSHLEAALTNLDDVMAQVKKIVGAQ